MRNERIDEQNKAMSKGHDEDGPVEMIENPTTDQLVSIFGGMPVT